MDPITEKHIAEIKSIRVAQQRINDRLKALADSRPVFGAEAQLAFRNGQQVRHWCGEALGVIRDQTGAPEHPYPEADNPDSTAIEPATDTEG